MRLITLKQRSKEWLDYRRNKAMASDSSIILGISPYKTVEKLYEEKIKGYESTPNFHMQKGIELEPIALRQFEKETGLVLFPCVGEHENEWMAASFDGMTLEEDVIVEIKCNGKKNHEIAKKGKPVDFHFCQVQHQIYVAGIDFAYYYSFTETDSIIIEVKRDQEFIEIMLEKEYEFWQSLQVQQKE